MESIESKLSKFIKKYNLNLLVKGLLLTTILSVAFFLTIAYSEYFLRFNTTFRLILFWSFISLNLFFVVKWVCIPLLKLWKLRKGITNTQASKLIGAYFPEVKDKLINLLQLKQTKANSPLLFAAIEQKTQQLQVVPFTKAIDIKLLNLKWIKLAAIPLVLFLLTLVIRKKIIVESTQRLWSYNTEFVKPAPFQFLVKKIPKQVVFGQNLQLEVTTKGSAIPKEMDVLINNTPIRMQSNGNGVFTFLVENISQTKNIQFKSGDYNTILYTIEVKKLASLKSYNVKLNYPTYIQKPNENLTTSGEIYCPEGTQISWDLTTNDAETAILNGKSYPIKDGQIQLSQKVLTNSSYAILLGNKWGFNKDTINLKVNVIEDAKPTINAETIEDSTRLMQYYFIGSATDDYKVNKVNFGYIFTKANNKSKISMGQIKFPIATQGTQSKTFTYALNLMEIGLEPGDEISYYFEAWDNNAVRGSQYSRTSPKILRRKTSEEMRTDANKNAESISSSMSQAMQQSKKIEKQNKEMQSQFNQSKKMDWQNNSKLENLFEQQEKLIKELENIKLNNQKLQQQNKDYMKNPDELQKREEALNKALEDIKNPELEKLIEEIKKLMEANAPKEQIQKRMEEMQKQNNEVFKNLDALKEQFKQLQMERILEDQIQQIDKIQKEQEALKEQTQQNKSKSEELKQEQQKLENKLKESIEAIKEAEKLNKDLTEPLPLEFGEKESKEAADKMDKSEKELEKNNKKEAEKEQKDAIEELKKMSDKLKGALEKAREEQVAEDYETTRQLLENLVLSSVEQEAIFTELNLQKTYGPRSVFLNAEQMKVREKCLVLEDSLRTLAKRQPMVSTFITQEINRINQNMGDALDHLKVRELRQAGVEEQYVMTGLNNLAVLLMESMQNMQSQMNKSKKEGGSCKKPGKGDGKSKGLGKKSGGKGNGKLSQGQKELGEMMQKLQQGQGKKEQGGGEKEGKEGDKKGEGKKPGNEGKGNNPGGKSGAGAGSGNSQENSDKSSQMQINKEYAQIALMQEMMRRKLETLRQELLKNGNTQNAENLRKTEQLMEQTERDLVNKKITNQTIDRQKTIETRLLQHENANNTQEQSTERESEKTTKLTTKIPDDIAKKAEQLKNQLELLLKTNAELSPYYKQKTKEYLQFVQ